jgi:hypothetical protein
VDTSFICRQAPFLASLPRSKPVYIVWFLHLILLYILFIVYLLTSNPYYLENHFVLFCFVLFLFLFCCLDGVHQPPHGRTGEISRDYASPRCEDIKIQESDSKLEATKYESKAMFIKMAAATHLKGWTWRSHIDT